jgi:hypothetical protein
MSTFLSIYITIALSRIATAYKKETGGFRHEFTDRQIIVE